MFIWRNKFFLVLISLFLIGCATVQEDIGVGDLEWSSYSPSKQKKLLGNYSKIIKEKRARSNNEIDKLHDAYLKVSVSDGKVMFPPLFVNWQNYHPVEFDISEGQCRNVEIKSKANEEVKTELGVCFRKRNRHG